MVSIKVDTEKAKRLKIALNGYNKPYLNLTIIAEDGKYTVNGEEMEGHGLKKYVSEKTAPFRLLPVVLNMDENLPLPGLRWNDYAQTINGCEQVTGWRLLKILAFCRNN